MQLTLILSQVAVISAVPPPMLVTLPFASTMATVGSEVVHFHAMVCASPLPMVSVTGVSVTWLSASVNAMPFASLYSAALSAVKPLADTTKLPAAPSHAMM